MSFTAKDVMALRQQTGMGMMECKKALTESDGNLDTAKEWLRERAKGKMEQRTERATGQGRIGIAVDGKQAAIVEVKTESDFTARNEAFVEMVNDIARMALSQSEGDISQTDEISKRIDDVRLVTKENTVFSRGQKLEGGACYGEYVHHDGKRAALVELDGEADPELLKGLCQHIVFHDPAGISEDDVTPEEIQRVRAEAIQEAKDTGKPEEIAAKIADGRVRKFLEENTLLHQKYVLDESKSIKETLPGGVSIRRFIRYTLGQ